MRPKATAQSWRIKPMPAQTRELFLEGTYSPQEMTQIALGFVPVDQQDRWFLYFDDAWLHVHRSWTGTCVFQLQLLPQDGWFSTDRLIVNQDPVQYRMTDDAYNVALVSYLIDYLLLNRFAELPLPGKMSDQDAARHRQHLMGDKPSGAIRLNLVNGRS